MDRYKLNPPLVNWLKKNSVKWRPVRDQLAELGLCSTAQSTIYQLSTKNELSEQNALNISALILFINERKPTFSEALTYVEGNREKFFKKIDDAQITFGVVHDSKHLPSRTEQVAIRSPQARLAGLKAVAAQLEFSAGIGLVGLYRSAGDPGRFHDAVRAALTSTQTLRLCARANFPMLGATSGNRNGWLIDALNSRTTPLKSITTLIQCGATEEGKRQFVHCRPEQIESEAANARLALIRAWENLPSVAENVEIATLKSEPMPFSMLITDGHLFVEPHAGTVEDGTFDVLEYVKNSAESGGTNSYDRLADAFDALFARGTKQEAPAPTSKDS